MNKKQKILIPKHNEVLVNKGKWLDRVLIGTPMTGLLRVEWVMARFGQVIPVNWSSTDAMQWISTYAPLQYLVADAQNLIVRTVIERNFEWLILLESDNVLPPGAWIKFNDYMSEGKIPVVSGLYFTKSEPPEPLLFRGRGNSFYRKWKMGDKVWVDGVPTGCLLIHSSILKAMWKESPEYVINGEKTRKVFETPAKQWYDPEMAGFHSIVGTSDLQWCERVIKEKFLEKAGWKEFQKKEFPFLVDTDIYCGHITEAGQMFPLKDPKEYGF